jgi:hypothetical protein
MPNRLRPLLAVRLIGLTEVVTTHKGHLLAHFAESSGERAICRVDTRAASYASESRLYLTITAKEVPPR